LRDRLSTMNFFTGSILGFFFGLFFGAGCALALMYAIYTGGYRKAIQDSLREEKSNAYRRWRPYVEKRLKKEAASSGAEAPALSSSDSANSDSASADSPLSQ
jgi:hypothetical protein